MTRTGVIGFILLVLTASWFSALASASTLSPVVINGNLNNVLYPTVEYKLTPQESLSGYDQSGWQTTRTANLNFGYTADFLWLRFQLVNQTDAPQKLYLLAEFPRLDELTLYRVNGHNLEEVNTIGDKHALAVRPLKDFELVFPIQLEAKQSRWIYLKAKTDGTMSLPLSIWQAERFLEHKTRLSLSAGLMLGLLLASAVILISLYVMTRKGYFLMGGLFNLCAWLMLIAVFGLAYRYISDNFQWLSNGLIPASAIVCCIFINLISVKVLGTKQLGKFIFVLLRLFVVLSVVTLLVSLWLDYGNALMLASCISAVHLSVLFLATLLLKFKYHLPVYKLAGSQLALLLGSYFNLSIIFGANVNTLSQIVLFGLCQIVATSLLSFVLIERFIIERDNKVSRQQTELAKAKANEELQSETIRIKDAYQEELEANIQERTFELEIALRELQDKNRELEELNTQDALTGVRNRRYFDKKITMEYRRSRREQTLLSILMLDIDHFKNVNDSYGHLVGDEAIKFVADTIVQQLKRPSDIICRYGGEEFAVLLPNTDPPGALLVAEEIRQAICAKALNTSAGEIKITISCGVFSAIASAQIDPHQYTDNADKALYQAKQAGRNCVVLAENSYHHHEEA